MVVWVVVNRGEEDEAIVQVSKAAIIRLAAEQGDGGSTAIVASFRDGVENWRSSWCLACTLCPSVGRGRIPTTAGRLPIT
jgi:hypothetical protein